MENALNWLIKLLGAFLTSYGILLTQQDPISHAWVIGLFTIGLALLFAPEVKGKK